MRATTLMVRIDPTDNVSASRGGAIEIDAGGAYLHLNGDAEAMDRLAAVAALAAQIQRGQVKTFGCEGSELPDAEYPYGSAVGTAA